MKFEVITLTIALVIGMVLGVAVYFATLPSAPRDGSKAAATSLAAYMADVYTSNENAPDVEKLNYLWDTATKDMRTKIPIAPNTSLEWPPKKGTRSKIVAFPYPSDIRPHSLWHNTAQAIKLLLNATEDKATFPGWLTSIYDGDNPNGNEYGRTLAKYFENSWKTANVGRSLPKPKYIEVMHACYPPTGQMYPLCDDGGFWLYMAPGSGVFWNSGQRVLVANNKLHAVQQLADYIRQHQGLYLVEHVGNKVLCDLIRRIGCADSGVAYIANKWRDASTSESNLMSAIHTVVKSWEKQSHSNAQQSVLVVAFRSMEKSDARSTWLQTILTTCCVCAGMAGWLLCVVRAWWLAASSRKRNLLTEALGRTLIGVVITVLLYYAMYYLLLDRMLEGFGWFTLPKALRRSGLALEDFIEKAIDGTNLLANGANITQNFDLDIELMMAVVNCQTCIMHAQPNKGGMWAIEIVDMREFLKNPARNVKLGVCGFEFPGATDKTSQPATDAYALMRGPLRDDDFFLGYQPTENCKCPEEVDRLCTACEGTASAALC